MRRRRGSRGFTLIEIMIVILIIGILLAFMLPNMVRSKYQAQWTSCGRAERDLAVAVESYNADHGTYPATLVLLTTSTPVYISLVPSCPTAAQGVPYAYQPGRVGSSVSSTYDIYTITCPGTHSLVLQEVSPGFPQYNPQSGLLQYNAGH